MPVAVLDWGVRPLARPGLFVDHHAHESASRNEQLVVSGYGERPETATAAPMRRVVPEAPAWLAAVGAFGDLGAPGLRLAGCSGAPREATRRLASLINAPRRLPDGPVELALALLVESASAVKALRDPRARTLASCQQAWRAALRSALRVAPRVGERAR